MVIARRRFHLFLAAVISALCLSPLAGSSQQADLTDQQMRAAYALNFIRYMDWPERSFPAPEAPLMVCTLGGESGAAALAGLGGKVIKGHPIQLRAAAGADDARGCHVLFVLELDARRVVGTLRSIQHLPVLTIGEADGFIEVGGMIGLIHLDNRLQFEVNLGVVQHAQLKASSQLLRLARNVIEVRPR